MINFLSYWIFINFIATSFTIRKPFRIPRRFYGPDIRWGWDCPGNDIYQFRSTPQDCLPNCVRTEGCTHVVWRDINDGTCWLKKGKFSLDNATEINDPDVMCASNTVTTYKSKLLLAFEVNVCLNDGHSIAGYTIINVTDTLRFPDFGESYICNNQQPWIVNDQLAYGYASIKMDDPTELDLCCACYQLNFTSAPAKGKTMIVQLIDYVNTYEENDIKLLIPGSATDWTYMDACNAQWKYKYPARVRTREECFNIPKPLQNGCLFRFDWLKNVQSSETIYTKVKCPQELIAKSGCSQGVIDN